MLHRAHALSSTTEAFNEECAKLRSIISRLDYPIGPVNSTINMFILSMPEKKIDDRKTIRIVLPFKDQIAANAVRRQLRQKSQQKDLRHSAANFWEQKIGTRSQVERN